MSQIEIAKKLLAELADRLERKTISTLMDEYGVQYPLFNYPIEETLNNMNEQEYEARNDAGKMDK